MVTTARYRKSPKQLLFGVPVAMIVFGFGLRGKSAEIGDPDPKLIAVGIILFIVIGVVCALDPILKRENENKEKLVAALLNDKYNSRPISREPVTNNPNASVPTAAEKIIRDENGMASPSYDPNAKFDPRVLELNRARMKKSLRRSVKGSESRYDSTFPAMGLLSIERTSAKRTDAFFDEIQQIAREKQASADIIDTIAAARNGVLPEAMTGYGADTSAAYAVDVPSPEQTAAPVSPAPSYPTQEPIPARADGAPTAASVYTSTLHSKDTYSKELGQGIADEENADDWLNY